MTEGEESLSIRGYKKFTMSVASLMHQTRYRGIIIGAGSLTFPPWEPATVGETS